MLASESPLSGDLTAVKNEKATMLKMKVEALSMCSQPGH